MQIYHLNIHQYCEKIAKKNFPMCPESSEISSGGFRGKLFLEERLRQQQLRNKVFESILQLTKTLQ